MQRKTVVLVCMVDSIHVARWIAQFDPKEVKFILFPSGPNRRVHPKILELLTRGKAYGDQITIVPFGGKLSLWLWALDRLFSERIRGSLLRAVLKRVSPDYIHALEFQHAGYVTLRALEDKSIKTPFLATNYGSDIYWFQKFPKHKEKIRRILDRADFYSAECQRDYVLAKNLGFQGVLLPLAPNAGGVDWKTSQPKLEKPSTRNVIAIKGYDGWVGRASVALEAIEHLGKELAEFEIHIYSSNLKVGYRARRIGRRLGLRITVHRKGSLSHEEILGIFARARIYVGLSLSDGISTSLLEAMSMGAFPIQTNTSCAEEWISDGKSGFLIREIVLETVAAAIRAALNSDSLVDNAQQTNFQTIQEKGLSEHFKSRIRAFYNLG
jgi:glycosyltransferase involved in cell wall biosynthesis